MKSDGIIFSFPNISLPLLPQLLKIFAEPLSHRERPFQLSAQGICQSFNDCSTFWSRSLSLFPFDSALKGGNNGFSVQVRTSFLDIITTVNRLKIRQPFPGAITSRSWHCGNSVCCGKVAARCSWTLKSFEILCGGDYGGVVAARVVPVAVWEVNRRVLVAGIEPVSGIRIGSTARHSTPSSGRAGRTSGSSQRCWRDWGSWQWTSRLRRNHRKSTDKDTYHPRQNGYMWNWLIHSKEQFVSIKLLQRNCYGRK